MDAKTKAVMDAMWKLHRNQPMTLASAGIDKNLAHRARGRVASRFLYVIRGRDCRCVVCPQETRSRPFSATLVAKTFKIRARKKPFALARQPRFDTRLSSIVVGGRPPKPSKALRPQASAACSVLPPRPPLVPSFAFKSL